MSFQELGLVLVIGLLVLGPERLPGAAVRAGRWLGRMRRTANRLRLEVERQIALAGMEHPEERLTVTRTEERDDGE